MKHTLESLVEALGLQHPDITDQQHKDWDYYPRQSGRTTKMLLIASLWVQEQPVLVLGHDARYTDTLQQQLMEICVKAEISSTENIIKKHIPSSMLLSHALKGFHNVKVFEDHYRLESISKWTKPKTFEEIVTEIADGNPGALMAIRALRWLSNSTEAIDWLHKNEIKGERLYLLWNDIYKRSGIQWCQAVKATMNIRTIDKKLNYRALETKWHEQDNENL